MQEVLISFSKLIIKHKLKVFADNDYQKAKLEQYLNKTIYNSLLYTYLLNQRNSEQSDLTETIAFNLFMFLGTPDKEFEVYMDEFSKSNNQLYFNSSGVLRLINKYLNTYNNPKDENKYFFMNHSGYCLILESRNNEIKYRSVFGVNRIAKSKINI